MSSTKTHSHNPDREKFGGITLKDLVAWGIGLGIVFFGGYVGMKITDAALDAKFDSFKQQTDKTLERHEQTLEKIDTKLDLVNENLNQIKLELKDKQNRK